MPSLLGGKDEGIEKMRKKINGQWQNVCKQCGQDLLDIGQCSRCRYCLNCCKCTIGGIGEYAYSKKGYKIRQHIIEKEMMDR